LARTLVTADAELLPGLQTGYHPDILLTLLLSKLGAQGAVAPTVAKHPDAALLRLGAELDDAWARENAYFATRVEQSGDDAETAMATCYDLVARIQPIPATTLDGLLVKARAFAWCRGDGGEVDLSDYLEDQATDTLIAGGILTDLMRMVAVPVAPLRPQRPEAQGLPGPERHGRAVLDAALVALCRRLAAQRAELEQIDRTGAADDVGNEALRHWWNLIGRITDMQARSPEGVLAKARALRDALKMRIWDGPRGASMADNPDSIDLLAWSFVHDALGEKPSWV
jgi:hypothetical protein